MRASLGGTRKYLLEGAHLVLRDDAVGLGHLGRQRDHRDREGHLAAQFRIAGENGAHGLDDIGNAGRRRTETRVTNSPRRSQIDMAASLE